MQRSDRLFRLRRAPFRPASGTGDVRARWAWDLLPAGNLLASCGESSGAVGRPACAPETVSGKCCFRPPVAVLDQEKDHLSESASHVGWMWREAPPPVDATARFLELYAAPRAVRAPVLLVGGIFTERYPGYLTRIRRAVGASEI